MSSEPKMCVNCEEDIQFGDNLCTDCLNILLRTQRKIRALISVMYFVETESTKTELLKELGFACLKEFSITRNAPSLRIIQETE